MTNAIATAGEIAKSANSGGWNITLDIAALLTALLWPIVLLIILVTYREQIPAMVRGLVGRLSKVEFAGVSIELAKAKPFAPDWSAGALDLRHKAAAIQVNDSTAATFLSQLREKADGDYAEVNLGDGKEWLTSRLYIIAIVFARMKAIKCFVFVETSGNTRRRFVCWAKPERIRWALARRFPWLEQSYADAYSTILSQRSAFVVSNDGRLGYQYSQHDPQPSIELLKEFLQRVQTPAVPPAITDNENWVLVDDATNTHEHSRWISSHLLEETLGEDANRSYIRSSELRWKSMAEQRKAILSFSGQFVAVTEEDQRFEYLVDRTVHLEQVAKQPAPQTDERN